MGEPAKARGSVQALRRGSRGGLWPGARLVAPGRRRPARAGLPVPRRAACPARAPWCHVIEECLSCSPGLIPGLPLPRLETGSLFGTALLNGSSRHWGSGLPRTHQCCVVRCPGSQSQSLGACTEPNMAQFPVSVCCCIWFKRTNVCTTQQSEHSAHCAHIMHWLVPPGSRSLGPFCNDLTPCTGKSGGLVGFLNLF